MGETPFNRCLMYYLLHLLILVLLYSPLSYGAQALPTDAEQAFLDSHWTGDTIPLQGKAPSDWSGLEASLQPEDCGKCHFQQYQDWSTSLHAKAMGPGIKGQLLSMVKTDPDTAKVCWLCHTPLAEQQNVLWNRANNDWQDNKAFDEALQDKGLVCAACHVRQHQRYGPPPASDRSLTGKVKTAGLPHNGFTAQGAFKRAAFCQSCHQFAPDGFSLNGKLIENTYEEWRASAYGQQGKACQVCHMPKGRHLWRGIHDKDMTRQAVTIEVDAGNTKLSAGELLKASIKLSNTGAGHFFPTYITPKVIVRGSTLSATGEVLESSVLEATIGREVTLDLSSELFDTRIPPGDFVEVEYARAVDAQASVFKVEVVVYPDHFYERFYRARLESDLAPEARKMLHQAWVNSTESSYLLYEKKFALTITEGKTVLRPRSLAENPGATNTYDVDWNAQQIKWYGYEEGLAKARELNKPVMLLFYAQWCPTCHAYRDIFYRQDITRATEDFVMVRVDADQFPDLNRSFMPDGDYVPRVFMLAQSGSLLPSRGGSGAFQYFIPATNPERFLELMREVLSHFNTRAKDDIT